MQHIGAYGLHIDVLDPETEKIFGAALAVPVPGPLTDRISEIAKKYNMYIIAPYYEVEGDTTVYIARVILGDDGNGN